MRISSANVSAQQYVDESEAIVLVQAEIQTIETTFQNSTAEDKTPALATLAHKLEFLQAVNLRLLDGESVADAIIHGVEEAEVADYIEAPSVKGIVHREPLHQEVVDLLSL